MPAMVPSMSTRRDSEEPLTSDETMGSRVVAIRSGRTRAALPNRSFTSSAPMPDSRNEKVRSSIEPTWTGTLSAYPVILPAIAGTAR